MSNDRCPQYGQRSFNEEYRIFFKDFEKQLEYLAKKKFLIVNRLAMVKLQLSCCYHASENSSMIAYVRYLIRNKQNKK